MTELTVAFVWVLVSQSGQIEQGAHYIRESMIYSMRKAVVELVYIFDEKSYHQCMKI